MTPDGQRAKGGTPSRLQNVSAAPRAVLHDLQGTLAGVLLAGLPSASGNGPPAEKFPPPSLTEDVQELDSTAAASFTVPSSGVRTAACSCQHTWR